MTKIECKKCEKLMYEAMLKANVAQEEYNESEKHLKDGNELEWEVAQRKADRHYGEAVGIKQALATLGFKHERMKELSKLI